MKYLKYIVVIFIILNVPSYFLVKFGSTFGAILSQFLFLLTFIFAIQIKKITYLQKLLLIFGTLFFIISNIIDTSFSNNLIVTVIKFILIVISIQLIIKDIPIKHINFILVIGAVSVIYEFLFLINITGRYSGFYLNPNFAGLISIIGFSLSKNKENNNITSIIYQFIFLISGILTFSRTFLVILGVVVLTTIFFEKKYIIKVIVISIAFSSVFSLTNQENFNTQRFNNLTDLMNGEVNDKMNEGSRSESWSKYYDPIYENPFFGNGYQTFSGKTHGLDTTHQGVHNTYLMILGESGIIPLLFFIFIIIYLFNKTLKTMIYSKNFIPLLILISLLMYLLTTHVFFESYIAITMLFFIDLMSKKTNNTININKI